MTKPPNDSSWAKRKPITPWLDVYIGYITGFWLGYHWHWQKSRTKPRTGEPAAAVGEGIQGDDLGGKRHTQGNNLNLR